MRTPIRAAAAGFLTAVGLLYSAGALADLTVQNVLISKLATRVTAFYLVLDGTVDDPGCANRNTVWVGIDPNTFATAQYRDIISTVQLAYTLGRRVTLYTSGCLNGYPKVVYIDSP